uniref:Gypsy retrotransposon integrase-like protein 1 n=1 Tax=Anolis carolinensis TaxID=28377 RepID=A0A803TR04_ANOCA
MLDCGCTRCLITPELANRLGVEPNPLKTPVVFAQLDGTPAYGVPVTEKTGFLRMTMGSHAETLQFVISTMAHQPVILGVPWLRWQNPQIDWKRETFTFWDGNCNFESTPKDIEVLEPEGAIAAMSQGVPLESVPRVYHEFAEVFSEKECDQLPPHRKTDCAIEIDPNAKLPKPKLYAMSEPEKRALREFIDKNIERGFIKPSQSPMAAPVFFRPKADGLRLVVDYRGLNAISTTNQYPLPLMSEMLAQLGEARIFTKLDLREAFYRIRIKDEDCWKTAFNCHLGQYHFKVLPFGLCGGPKVFMQFINETFRDMLYKGVIIYLDDILLYSKSLAEHIRLTREVLRRLKENQLYAKLSKCEFHKTELDYLGFRISTKGIAMDPAKVQDVLAWEPPRTRRQLQGFLGFANFYRQFIKDFAKLSLPLTELLKTKGVGETRKTKTPGAKLNWTPECQEVFEELKRRFTSQPILVHAQRDKPFVVHCDASEAAYGAILLQADDEGALRPCAYLSRKFTETERNWRVWEKEAFAVKAALSHWRHFLEGTEAQFEVWTDHKNLQALRTPQRLNAKQLRWAQFFNRFNFKLKFFPGTQNRMADALSRMPDANYSALGEVGTVFTKEQLGLMVQTRATAKEKPPPSGQPHELSQELRLAADADPWLQSHRDELSQTGGLWTHGSKYYVPEELRGRVLAQAHDSKLAGHFGFTKTLKLLNRQFWWPTIRKDVKGYLQECPVCAMAKQKVGRPEGLLQSVADPSRPWTDIAMDFVVDLPNSNGFNTIWTIIDLFSKQAHFVALKRLPTAPELAKLFLQHVFRLHGCPKRIISDRGSQFTSRFWKSFLGILGTERALSTAFHPETDGATERVQKTLQQFLRCYSTYQQDQWSSMLPLAEYCINNSDHASTGVSPFKVVNGRDFPPFPALQKELPSDEKPGNWGEKIAAAWPSVQEALRTAKVDYKKYADRKRTAPPDYKVGELVYLSTKHLKSTQPSRKLSPRYVGPFPISAVVNPVTVRLQLPHRWRKVHPVFHVSLLKPAPNTHRWSKPGADPVPIMVGAHTHFEIKDILDSKKSRGKLYYLVQWSSQTLHPEWVAAEHVKAPKLRKQFHTKFPHKPGP